MPDDAADDLKKESKEERLARWKQQIADAKALIAQVDLALMVTDPTIRHMEYRSRSFNLLQRTTWTPDRTGVHPTPDVWDLWLPPPDKD